MEKVSNFDEIPSKELPDTGESQGSVPNGFFIDTHGNLHRGVPVIVTDEHGNEMVYGLDFTDQNTYPLADGESSAALDGWEDDDIHHGHA